MFVQLPARRRIGPRWATPLVCAALAATFLWVGTRPESRQAALLLGWGALTGGPVAADTFHALWAEGRWLRLFTALFLHADWAHLLGNLVFLLIFGLPAERAMGPWRFLALFLLGGAVANLATVFTIGGPARSLIGASGAVSAVIGAYLALFPRARLGVVLPLGLFLEFIRAPALVLIGIWGALQVVFAYIGPAFGAVAWSAHVAGFLAGVAFAFVARKGIRRHLNRSRGYGGPSL